MAGLFANLCYMGKPPPVLKKPMKSPAASSTLTHGHGDRVVVSPAVGVLQKSSLQVLGLKNSSTSTHVFVPTTISLPYNQPNPISTTRSARSGSRSGSSTHVVMAAGGDHHSGPDHAKDDVDKPALDNTQQQKLQKDTTPYVPIYVMLPLGVINDKCELVDPGDLLNQLRILKSINVDGVMVDCWWGIVEADGPQEYKWYGYKRLFQLVRDLKLKLQVVMSFHSCGGNVGDDVNIKLPDWVLKITKPNIFFTDEQGRTNKECLTWGIDDIKVLHGRSAVDVYTDYMRSFRKEFSTYFDDGTISEIEVGLGPCGELRYPSYPEIHGWRYPGIGQFQCYDPYLKNSLRSAAYAIEKFNWEKVPSDMGMYNSRPQESRFFCEGGEYDSYHGRFFLSWYAETLITHGDRVLCAAKHIFDGTPIAAKLAGVHWWYLSMSHAAELTAGFYNPANRDGYTAIVAMLKKNDVNLNFTCVELRTEEQRLSSPDAMSDPERLVWQVLNNGWDAGIKVAAENALPCYTREGYEKILTTARPVDSPDGRHLCAFTYLRLSATLFEDQNFLEFKEFVARLHGK